MPIAFRGGISAGEVFLPIALLAKTLEDRAATCGRLIAPPTEAAEHVMSHTLLGSSGRRIGSRQKRRSALPTVPAEACLLSAVLAVFPRTGTVLTEVRRLQLFASATEGDIVQWPTLRQNKLSPMSNALPTRRTQTLPPTAPRHMRSVLRLSDRMYTWRRSW